MELLSVLFLLLQLQLLPVSSFTTRNNHHQKVRNSVCIRQRRNPRRTPTHHYSRYGVDQQYNRNRYQYMSPRLNAASGEELSAEDDENEDMDTIRKVVSTYDLGVGKNLPKVPVKQYKDIDTIRKVVPTYDLGAGKNLPVGYSDDDGAAVISTDIDHDKLHWNVPKDPNRKNTDEIESLTKSITSRYTASPTDDDTQPKRVRRMVARTEESSMLRGAIWDEGHYSVDDEREETEISEAIGRTISSSSSSPATPSLVSPSSTPITNTTSSAEDNSEDEGPFAKPELFYPNIDLSIPSTIYDPETSKDVVWDLMRWEAYQESQREPLLVSFLYSSILNHDSLESSLAFLLANKLSSAAMISTQIQSLILNALHKDRSIGRAIRADIMAVRDRDPACTCLPDVFLYFKGFHALQTYRVAHAIWKTDNKQVLAHYLQSQMSQTFQIDIHPNATLGNGIMLDHGTGIVIGETAHLGHNCSILHHVTLGGSGKKGVDRHPKVGNGVLLGAGTSVLGNVNIGDGCQVGAGGLVITDLPPHSVAVGVPVKIIGSFVDVTEQPSVSMNQTYNFLSDGI